MERPQAVAATAREFRAGLQSRAPHARLPGLRRFPAGACGDASRLLAERLRELGLGDWSIVSAWRDDRTASHAWLTCDGWTVDITADQFGEDVADVVVAQTSPWHERWTDRSVSSVRVGLAYYRHDSGAHEDYGAAARG